MRGFDRIMAAATLVLKARELLADERIPKRTKRGICRAVARLFFLRWGRVPNPYPVLDHSVSFLSEPQFRYLMQEIMLEASYMFESETKQPRIIDCGSNIGMSIIFFKLLFPNSELVAFEPDPETFAVLMKNINQNGLQGVIANCCALTDRDGTIRFYKPKGASGDLRMSIDARRTSGEVIQVPSRRLAPFLETPADLVKIDIEGAEDLVMRDLHETGVIRNARQIHLEYHHHINRDRDSLADVLQILESNNFGYQMRAAPWGRWPTVGIFQDISIYAYQKKL